MKPLLSTDLINSVPINQQLDFSTSEYTPKTFYLKENKINKSLATNTTLFGLELEIENITTTPEIRDFWNQHEDHSLRDNGVEYTTQPIQGKYVESALLHLNDVLMVDNKPVFSGRCSTHVHINVQDLSWENIYSFVLLYAIFEKHFFFVAGTKREENIFCVPLYKSTQLYTINTLKNYIKYWSKYNAINIAPILGNDYSMRYGTIEFRHLYGTLNPEIILSWVNTISKIKEACVKFKLNSLVDNILTMNSTSEYIQLYKRIFQEEALTQKMLKADFESCITNTKLALLKDNISSTSFVKNSHYAQIKYPFERKNSILHTTAVEYDQVKHLSF